MTSRTPTWWEFALLSLAAFRSWRIVGVDEILDVWRDRLVRAHDPARYRETLDRFLRCPWCLGFWITLVWYAFWYAWPTGTVVVAAPLAASAAVGLVARNLDP